MSRRPGKPELSLVPKAALEAIARAMAYGNVGRARGDYYAKGEAFAVDRLNATLRHLSACSEALNRAGGDPRAILAALDESGLPHAFHALASLAITLAIAPRPHAKFHRKPSARRAKNGTRKAAPRRNTTAQTGRYARRD